MEGSVGDATASLSGAAVDKRLKLVLEEAAPRREVSFGTFEVGKQIQPNVTARCDTTSASAGALNNKGYCSLVTRIMSARDDNSRVPERKVRA